MRKSKILLLVFALLFAENAFAEWYNPLSWFKITHKVDGATQQQINQVINEAAGFKETFDKLPANIRIELEPLLRESFTKMEKLIGTTEKSALNVAHVALQELNTTIAFNIDKLNAVFKENIQLLDISIRGLIDYGTDRAENVINKTIDKTDVMIEDKLNRTGVILSESIENGTNSFRSVVKEAINQADVSATNKVELIGALMSNNVDKFNTILQDITTKGDGILQARIGQIVDGFSKNLDKSLNKFDHTLIKFIKELNLSSKQFLVGLDTISKARVLDISLLLKQFEGVISKAKMDAEVLSSNTIISVVKGSILFLLIFFIYTMLSKPIQFTQQKKAMVGAFSTICLVLILWDKPLMSILASPATEYAISLEKSKDDIKEFYALYQDTPYSEKTAQQGKKVLATLKGLFSSDFNLDSELTNKLLAHQDFIQSAVNIKTF